MTNDITLYKSGKKYLKAIFYIDENNKGKLKFEFVDEPPSQEEISKQFQSEIFRDRLMQDPEFLQDFFND